MARGPRLPGVVCMIETDCSVCDRPILPGTRMQKRRGKWAHVGCCSGQDDE